MTNSPKRPAQLDDDLCAGTGAPLSDALAALETTVRASLACIDDPAGFVERALQSLANARQTQDYVDADVVIEQLRRSMEAARTRANSGTPRIHMNPDSQ